MGYSLVVRATAFVGLEYIYNSAVASGTLDVVPGSRYRAHGVTWRCQCASW